MISFRNFLLEAFDNPFAYITEGRDAPLYHGTWFDRLPQILESGYLKAKDPHMFTSKAGNIRAISTSRSFLYSWKWSDGVVIELDQNRISHNYKIVPYNDFYLSGSARPKFSTEVEEQIIVTKGPGVSTEYINKIWIKKDYTYKSLWRDLLHPMLIQASIPYEIVDR